jgi:hypothetical protein
VAAVNAYAGLPGVEGWAPPAGFQPLAAHRIVECGWPFAVLGENRSLNQILRKSVNGKFDPSDWSVIHAGALLTQLGARVEFLKESNKERVRTPDIGAWCGNEPVDAEVKTAMVKERQTELRRLMEVLREVIGSRTTPWHPVVHLGEVPVANVQSAIVDSVLTLGAGERAGVVGLWSVYAIPLDQGQIIVNPGGAQALRPAWWEDDGPHLVSLESSFSAHPEDIRRILIAGKLQFVSYLNQIREKADFPQNRPGRPFLIVLDQGSGEAMPIRHQRWQTELAPSLPFWPHVSGILCFDTRPYAFGRFCWNLSFHPNAHAEMPLPAPLLLSLLPHNTEICVRPFAE